MKSQIPHSIRDNLRFLIVEVGSQVSCLQNYITGSSNSAAVNIIDRSGYAFNLKVRIHNACHSHIAKSAESETDVLTLQSIDVIAGNLDRIAELCRDCIEHVAKLDNRNCLLADEYELLLDRVAMGISLIGRANLDSDTLLALKIGEIEQKLTQTCNQLLAKYTVSLKGKKHTEDLISCLFVAQSVKHLGGCLLKICEAILSGNLGQAVNIDRYHSLTDLVAKLTADKKPPALAVETIVETRSGSAVSGISKVGKEEIIAIIKDGKKRKLKEERQSVASWHEIYPGIAPKILSYNKHGQSAALLIEYLDGVTFESILLRGSNSILDEAFAQLCLTLKSVWKTTRRKKPVAAHYMDQTSRRINEVYAIHPEFAKGNHRVCGVFVASFDNLIKQAGKLETKLAANFSVYIHGDFNTDNIIYDAQEKKINFIDLHRSRYMDYVQDVSVFMVSNYRLHVLDPSIRTRALDLNLNFYEFASTYAKESGDKCFEIRLALGLARSFATSTRFILDKTLAKAMFMRSRYLIEHVLRTRLTQPTKYRIPIQEILLG